MNQMKFWFELLEKKRTQFHKDISWVQGLIDHHTTAPHKNQLKAAKAKGARFALRHVIDWMDNLSINTLGIKNITLDNYTEHFYSPKEREKRATTHLKIMFLMFEIFIITLILIKVLS